MKRITFRVLICLILGLLLSIVSYSSFLFSSPLRALPGFAALLLRDGALIVFLIYLYRRS